MSLTRLPWASCSAASRSRLSDLTRLVLLAGLIVWTAWIALQRPALRDAEAAFARGDHPTALRRALDDLARHPSARDPALIAARALSRELYADQAERYYDRAQRSAPLPPEALGDRIQGLILSNRWQKAADTCRAILADRPDDLATLRSLAFIEWSLGRHEQGIAVAETLAKLPGGRPDGLALLATNHHGANHPNRAVAAAEALLAIDPELKSYKFNPTVFWFELTEDLLALHRPAEVRDHLAKVLGTLKANGADEAVRLALHDHLGSALKDLGDVAGAEAQWRESARRDPSRLPPWFLLGRLYNGQKRFAEAAEVLEKALAVDPGHAESYYQLATSYRFLGRLDDAKALVRKAERLRRDSPATGGGMGPPP